MERVWGVGWRVARVWGVGWRVERVWGVGSSVACLIALAPQPPIVEKNLAPAAHHARTFT